MDWLLHLSVSSPLSYLIALLLPALDALIFILPAETAVIVLGVATAGSSDPPTPGDAHRARRRKLAGSRPGPGGGPARRRRCRRGTTRRPRARPGRRSAERALKSRGGLIIFACRFIPGGRTAVTLTCGLTGYPRRSFGLATACAGAVWASYAFFIGRLGGQAFEDRPLAGLVAAVTIVTVVTAIVEVGRRAAGRWSVVSAAREEVSGSVNYVSGERAEPAGAAAGTQRGE